MYFLYPVCCICLKYNSGLELLNTLQDKQLNYYLKISSDVADQGKEDVTKYCQICEECVGSLYSVCEFIDVCQRGRVAVRTYISQLQTESTVNEGTTAKFNQTNTDPFSAAVKTESPSGDLHSYTIHTELDLRPDAKTYISHPQSGSDVNDGLTAEYCQTNMNPFSAAVKTEPPSVDLHSELDLKPDPEECLNEYEQVISEDTKQDNIKTEVETDLLENDPLSAPELVAPVQVCSDSIHEQTSSDEDIFQNGIEIPEQTDLFTDSNSKGYETTKKTQTNEPKNSHKRDTSNSLIEKPYECKICKKQFNNTSNLKQHLKIHTGERRYECNMCEKKFMKPSDLTRHSRTHTGERPYECKICTKTFIDASRLKSHLRTHTDENPCQCKTCKKVFSTVYGLKEHSRSHAVERPYECKICNKKFNYVRNLTIHTRTHTGEKPYECKICTKTFNESSKLARHVRTHTGEKPFECKTCNKRFATAHCIKVHSRLHTGEKPYKCKICKKDFTTSSGLKVHSKAHTDEDNYSEPCSPLTVHTPAIQDGS